ncbi:MAG: glycosyltransferase family 2 protein [Lachnospiraceae bacterium]|jgi:GT2 family glycosyltransferase
MDNLFYVEMERFHIQDSHQFVLRGWFPENVKGNCEFQASLNQSYLPVEVTHIEGVEIRKKYLRLNKNLDHEYYVWITLPDPLPQSGKLIVYQICEKERKRIWSLSVKKLEERRNQLDSYIETFTCLPDGRISVGGWAVSIKPFTLQVKDEKGRVLESENKILNRKDLASNYPEKDLDFSCGFECIFDAAASSRITVSIVCDGKQAEYTYRVGTLKKGKGIHDGPDILTKTTLYFKRNGAKKTIKRVYEKVFHKEPNGIDYNKWLLKHLPSEAELQLQRQTRFDEKIRFSVVVPLYKTPEKYLRALIASLEEQTYPDWELCFSDGSGQASPLTGILEEYQQKDQRIRVVSHEQPLKISENTNAALEIATGDYIVFADHDDILPAHALFECARAIHENAEIDMIYSDEDKVSMDGGHYFQSHFKPDYSPDLLCSMNYFCHLVVVKAELQKKVGGLNPEYDGAQDYDFVLRCTEVAQCVHHIPKILYHWRAHMDSTAENPESKLYAFEAGKRAIEAHYQRVGIHADVVQGEYLGLYRSLYHLDTHPLVSIVIPNKDHIEDLDKCISSLLQRSTYDNFEVIIVENNSTEEATFAYYRHLEDTCKKVKVLYWKDAFNYSAINNFGVEHAGGEYILLLNNDTEIINNNCIEELLGYCMRPDVGIVGARLYFEDDTVQHAGVVIGIGGAAGHLFIGSKRGDNGYFSRLICACDYSAVTAACLMVKKSVFQEVNGLDPEFQVAFNDVDFCLKVREKGYLVVYNPYAELYHYESKSRGQEDTPEKVARFNKEMYLLLEKWETLMKNGDPYYNPNLSLDKPDMSLRIL